MEERMMMSGD
ncbi:hypothetical protein PRCB_21485 [Pantoea rodasii]|uniref:Uncharacterized protein n=1 Tax=Pantoea rodasii TaxID=1076549 RepID=A0A2M9W8P1_9GAMM|nr:hypothetical protein [Pantoea sp. alder69]MCA1252470.1 hypothetical protein [Pantoea sp. alder70]MCA1266790.1 hypothetical protein [Pantoea sp. alder81]PJZ03887.1 hypothetical protein PRCB_21485 [Pantoea rodasii]